MTWHLSPWFHFRWSLLVFIFINAKPKLLAVFLVVSRKDGLWVRPYLLFISLHISPGARLSPSHWFYSDDFVLQDSKYQSAGVCQRLHHFFINHFDAVQNCITTLQRPSRAYVTELGGGGCGWSHLGLPSVCNTFKIQNRLTEKNKAKKGNDTRTWFGQGLTVMTCHSSLQHHTLCTENLLQYVNEASASCFQHSNTRNTGKTKVTHQPLVTWAKKVPAG